VKTLVRANVQSEWRKPAEVLELVATGFLFLFVLVQPLSIAAAQIAYSGAALAWIVRLLLVRRGVLHGSPLDAPILIYWFLCVLSTLLSPLPGSSWEGMRKVSLVFIVLLVAHLVPSRRRARQLIALLFFSGLVSVAAAGWEFAAGVGLHILAVDPGTSFYRAGISNDDVLLRVDGRLLRRPEQFLAHLRGKPARESLKLLVVHGGGISILKDAVPVILPAGDWPQADGVSMLGMRIETARPARARAFYSHYVTYAMLLELLAALVFGLWLACPNPFSLTGFRFAGLFLAFVVALGATLTRAAWLALAFACAVQVWMHFRRWSVRVFLPAVLLLALLGTNIAMHRWRGMGVIDLKDPGTDYRLLMWRDGLRLIREHPWFGVGMNVVRDAWWKFDLAAYKKYGDHWHFHSTPIQMAVEVGLLAFLAWVFLMVIYGMLLIRLVRRTRAEDPFVYGLALGILGGACGFLVSSLAQYNFGDSVVVLLFWFLAGLAVALRRQVGETAA
jgi:O-antigen ligase